METTPSTASTAIVPIARHATTDGYLEVRIYKMCEAKLGKGWWRRL